MLSLVALAAGASFVIMAWAWAWVRLIIARRGSPHSEAFLVVEAAAMGPSIERKDFQQMAINLSTLRASMRSSPYPVFH